MKIVAELLHGIALFLMRTLLVLTCILSIPALLVAVAACAAMKLEDDLRGEWRRGREQTRLWQWARDSRERP